MRRVRDSNPRYPFGYTHFPGVLLQPLGQLSIIFIPLIPFPVYSLSPANTGLLQPLGQLSIIFIPLIPFPVYSLSPANTGLLQPLGQLSIIFIPLIPFPVYSLSPANTGLLQPLGQLSIFCYHSSRVTLHFYDHKKRAQIYKLKMNLTFDQLIKFSIQKIKILRLPFKAKN